MYFVSILFSFLFFFYNMKSSWFSHFQVEIPRISSIFFCSFGICVVFSFLLSFLYQLKCINYVRYTVDRAEKESESKWPLSKIRWIILLSGTVILGIDIKSSHFDSFNEDVDVFYEYFVVVANQTCNHDLPTWKTVNVMSKSQGIMQQQQKITLTSTQQPNQSIHRKVNEM